jgi:hypothetical protein
MIGELEGSHSDLVPESNHLYLVGGHMGDEWKYEIKIVNGQVIKE